MEGRPAKQLQESPPTPDRCGDSDGQLLAQMIHDLKNPLSVILCYSEIIPEAEPTELEEYCRRLHANARALVDLLDGFALLADLREDRASLSREPVDWCRLVRELVADLGPVARFRGQRVICDTAGDRGILGDGAKLTLTVRHFLLEALRLGPPGTDLTVRARAERHGVFVQVIVPGDGDGALPFDLQRPVLQLVQRVVRLHEGTISFDLQPNSVVATIYLPAR